jgi:hypothetical protein
VHIRGDVEDYHKTFISGFHDAPQATCSIDMLFLVFGWKFGYA